jgi:hypothetical protein
MARSRTVIREERFQAALARAQANKLSVVKQGVREVDNRTAYYVPSVSQPGMLHQVVYVAADADGNGGALICDCYAAWRGTYCQHRAVVRAYLLARDKQPA